MDTHPTDNPVVNPVVNLRLSAYEVGWLAELLSETEANGTIAAIRALLEAALHRATEVADWAHSWDTDAPRLIADARLARAAGRSTTDQEDLLDHLAESALAKDERIDALRVERDALREALVTARARFRIVRDAAQDALTEETE